MITLFVTVLLFSVLCWAARALMAAWGVPDPIKTTVYVLLVVIAAFWLIQQIPFLLRTVH